MPITPGARLGSYEVLSLLGAGDLGLTRQDRRHRFPGEGEAQNGNSGSHRFYGPAMEVLKYQIGGFRHAGL